MLATESLTDLWSLFTDSIGDDGWISDHADHCVNEARRIRRTAMSCAMTWLLLAIWCFFAKSLPSSQFVRNPNPSS